MLDDRALRTWAGLDAARAYLCWRLGGCSAVLGLGGPQFPGMQCSRIIERCGAVPPPFVG